MIALIPANERSSHDRSSTVAIAGGHEPGARADDLRVVVERQRRPRGDGSSRESG
jgi:hypothetical protein